MAPVTSGFNVSCDRKGEGKQRTMPSANEKSLSTNNIIPEDKPASLPVATSAIFGMTPSYGNYDVTPRSQGWLDWFVMPMGQAKLKDLNVFAPVST